MRLRWSGGHMVIYTHSFAFISFPVVSVQYAHYKIDLTGTTENARNVKECVETTVRPHGHPWLNSFIFAVFASTLSVYMCTFKVSVCVHE